MIVTFISECENKALKRSRRVLDAFANRIGNNTWQTVITYEGLQAVKKLLRKTATKNTAVSCHKIKSRKLTELLWIVGSRNKFNNEGFVAVNYTEQDRFIGEINMEKIYANTQTQPLTEHLFAVGVVAQEIMKTFCNDKQLQKAAFVAGCWHDIGKLEVHFQYWLNNKIKKKGLVSKVPDDGVHIDGGRGFVNFSFEKYPTHNEVSILIYQLLADDTNFGKKEQEAIKHSVYWHHAKPIRKDEIKTLTKVFDKLEGNKIDILINQSKSILKNIEKISKNYFDDDFQFIKKSIDNIHDIDNDKNNLPSYKVYETSKNIERYQEQIKKNAKKNLIRTSVITADRLVSSLSSSELQNYIENKNLAEFTQKSLIDKIELSQHIKTCLNGFETRKNADKKRNAAQTKAAKNLADENINISVLQGPAGCGKTKIALEWILNIGAKQIFWICPRVAICQSLFKDLSSNDYLPKATMEIHTGEFKYTNKKLADELTEQDYFLGDIVLTTIDQVINSITTHKNITTLTKFMNSAVVFDEFHEYIPMAGFNILFAELIECKRMQQDDDSMPSTLLVSATPNYYFLDKFLGITDNDIISIDSFNDKPYKIEFVEYDECVEDNSNIFYNSVNENTFVISNTAITAQKSFIDNQEKENSILIHSKFTPQDRAEIFSKVIDSFKEDGTHKIDVVRSGPIIQAALNISCQNIISEISTAENTLQRLGRLNRFAEYDKANFTIVFGNTFRDKNNGNSARFLNKNFQLQSTKVWLGYLDDKLTNNNQYITINQLYKFYKEFHDQENSRIMIEQDFIASLKDGVRLIEENIFDPIRIKHKNIDKIKLKKHSLRGNSRFVQMAICNIKTRSDYEISNSYLVEAITIGVDDITNYGDDNSPLEFMVKKHHNIFDNVQNQKDYGVKANTKYKTKIYLNKSRVQETPIYISYTQDDLDKIKATANSAAIYYLQGLKQAIGIIPLDRLKKE